MLRFLQLFQHTAARRRLIYPCYHRTGKRRFNTQPPEGGCFCSMVTGTVDAVSTHSRPKAAVKQQKSLDAEYKFQHTAARRRLVGMALLSVYVVMFQHTAARRRLKGNSFCCIVWKSFNTQPPEGGCQQISFTQDACNVSTHSRPKAADSPTGQQNKNQEFQHTAARRRLFAIDKNGLQLV